MLQNRLSNQFLFEGETNSIWFEGTNSLEYNYFFQEVSRRKSKFFWALFVTCNLQCQSRTWDFGFRPRKQVAKYEKQNSFTQTT